MGCCASKVSVVNSDQFHEKKQLPSAQNNNIREKEEQKRDENNKANLEKIQIKNKNESPNTNKRDPLPKNKSELTFEEYEVINLQRLYQNNDNGVTVNLVANVADPSISFFVQKQIESKEEYQQEKNIYKSIEESYQNDLKNHIILMQHFNDQKQEVYFSFGKCTLKELASYIQDQGKLIPNVLILLVFKIVVKVMIAFYEKSNFYTDAKPENLVLEFNEQLSGANNNDSNQPSKQVFDLKFIDLGSYSDKLQISGGYTVLYFTSPLMLQRKKNNQLIFKSKEERFYNELYTLVRTLQKILMKKESEILFKQIENDEILIHNNAQINQEIQEQYKYQIEGDPVNGKIVKKIFEFMKQFSQFQESFANDIKSVKQIVTQINVDYLDDDLLSRNILKIANDKIQHKAGEINPLEMILSVNCNIQLHCSRYSNQQSDKKLEDTLFEYLNNKKQQVFLLLGKSGSGKSLFIRKFYAKLNRISTNCQNQSVESTEKQKQKIIPYPYQCKYIKLNQYDSLELKESFQEQVQMYLSEIEKEKNDMRLILLLDGFDEFGEGKEQIMDLIGLKNNRNQPQRVKVIVTSRSTEISEQEQRNIFNFGLSISEQDDCTETGYICAINHAQTHEYIKKFVEIVNMYKDSKLFGKFNAFKTYEEYKEMLDNSTALQDIATEPFTIRLLVGIMPDIRDKYGQKSNKRINLTLLEVLHIYTQKWIENEIFRLNQDERYTLAEDIANIDLNGLNENIPSAIESIEKEALKITEYLWVNNKISNNSFSKEDLSEISEKFNTDMKIFQVVIKCLPIIAVIGQSNAQYGFFHKSIIDCYLAQLWLNDFANVRDQDAILELSTLSIAKKFIAPNEFFSLTMLANYVLEQSNRKEIDQFLYKQFVSICLQILELSKKSGFQELQGSSNAITILNFLKFSFSGLNLSHIKIKNANLDQAIFDTSDLSYSQIESTILSRVCLNNCNFQGASLTNVDFKIPKPEFLGHQGLVLSVAISKDSKYLVSGSEDKTVKIWDFGTGELIKTLNGHTQIVKPVAITPNNKFIVSGSYDGTVKIWRLIDGEEVATLLGHTAGALSVAITSDSKYIIVGSGDNNIRIWKIENGMLLKTATGHTGAVNSVAINSNNQFIVSGSNDKTIKVWDFEQGKELKTLIGHNEGILSVTMTTSSEFIVSGSDDRTIKVWNLKSGKELMTLMGHSGNVYSVDISFNGKYIVSGSGDMAIKIWDMESGQLLQTLTGHIEPISSVKFSNDGKYIVSGSGDTTIKIWNFESQTQNFLQLGHNSPVLSLAISPDEKFAASGSRDKTIKLWNLETGAQIQTIVGHTDSVWTMAMSSDGQYIVSGSYDTTLKVWKCEDGSLVRTLSGHSNQVISVIISANCKVIVSSDASGQLFFWKLDTGELAGKITEGHAIAYSLALSKDSRYMVYGNTDSSIKILSLETSQEIRTLLCHNFPVRSVTFSPDDQYIISGSDDMAIRIWKFETGEELRTLQGHSNLVMCVKMSQDGQYIFSASYDNTIKIWDFNSGKLLRSLSGHNNGVITVALTPDNKRIISASEDNSIKIWNIETLFYSVQNLQVQEEVKIFVEGDSDQKYSVFIRKDGNIQISLVQSSSQNQVSQSSNQQKQESSQNLKKKENWVFFGSNAILSKRVIYRNSAHTLIKHISQDPICFSCEGINLNGCMGLNKNQLRILAQKSKQNLNSMIDQAKN